MQATGDNLGQLFCECGQPLMLGQYWGEGSKLLALWLYCAWEQCTNYGKKFSVPVVELKELP